MIILATYDNFSGCQVVFFPFEPLKVTFEIAGTRDFIRCKITETHSPAQAASGDAPLSLPGRWRSAYEIKGSLRHLSEKDTLLER